MLKTETLDFIRDCARQYDVKAVWLFGSALGDEALARDIDLSEDLPIMNVERDFILKEAEYIVKAWD